MKHYSSALFIIFILTSVAAKSQHNDELFLSSALTKLKNSKEYTLKVAALMPFEKYNYRPTVEEMSFGQQLIHICTNLGWLSSAYLSDGKTPVLKSDNQLQNKDSIQAVIIRTYDYAISAISNFESKNLADTVKFFAGPMNKLQIINLISDHQTHHRGQLMVYLRLCGLTPPKYVGW